MQYEELKGKTTVLTDTYRAWSRIGTAILAVVIFLAVQFVPLLFRTTITGRLWLPGVHAIAAVSLVAFALFQLRKADPKQALAGHDIVSGLKLFLPIILLLALAGAGMEKALGIPREDYMIRLYDGLSIWQCALFVTGIVIFPPISEELLYRHFMMRAFPLHKPLGMLAAVIVTASVFAWTHVQYHNWTSTLQIGALGVAFAVARLRTGGILVPIAMHSLAEVVGLAGDWMLGHWG